jgi:hypothetical protein
MGAMDNRTILDLGPLVETGALSITPTGIIQLGFEAWVRKSRSDRKNVVTAAAARSGFLAAV